MHEDLTERFCWGLREKGHWNLLAAMEDMWSKPGQIRFEMCIANGYRIAQSEVSYCQSLVLGDYNSDSSTEFAEESSSDSDLSQDDRRFRCNRKGKERQKRQDKK